MKITTQRIGGALVAALLTAPLGIGIASAEVTPAPDDTETVAPTDEGTTPGDDPTTPAPTDESTTPTDDPTTPAPTPTPTDESTTPTDESTTPAQEEVVPTQDPITPVEEEVDADISAIVFSIAAYTDRILWMPSGRYTASLTGLRPAGLDTALAAHYDIPVTWTYSLNGGAATEFVPVDGAIEISGLVDGANTLVVTATYSVPSTSTGGISLFADERLTYSVPLTITVLPMADTVTILEEDTTIPSSTQQQGETLRYISRPGSFTPGETVTVTLIPVSGAPITVGTAVAGADGSLEVVFTAPTDLPVGVYYLLNEGAGGITTATVTRITVTPAPVVTPTTPATDAATGTTTGTTTSTSAVLAAAATTASSNGTTRLATTGADPSTGLAIGGLLTLAGAGAVIGARRLRSARATAQ